LPERKRLSVFELWHGVVRPERFESDEKNTTVEQNIKAAEIARKVGIGLGLNFIWGNKGDTEESLRKNMELIKTYNTYD